MSDTARIKACSKMAARNALIWVFNEREEFAKIWELFKFALEIQYVSAVNPYIIA